MTRTSTLILSIIFLTLLYMPGYTQTISGPSFAAATIIEPEMAKKIGYLTKIGINGMQPVDGIDGLIATLKDANEPSIIRVEAARAIGRLGDASAIAALQEASIIPSETMQLILSGFFDKKGITPNPDEIINANGEVGASAIVALERLYSASNEASQREGLLNLIQYSNAPVKREAALALAEAGDERALPYLKELALTEAHEKLKLLLGMKGIADADRTRKFMDILKATPSTSEEAARRGAAVSVLAETGEATLPAINDEIDRLGKKNKISDSDIMEFKELSIVALGIGSDKSIPVFEKLQSHPESQVSELSKVAISLLMNGVPAVFGGATFSGRGMLEKYKAGVVK